MLEFEATDALSEKINEARKGIRLSKLRFTVQDMFQLPYWPNTCLLCAPMITTWRNRAAPFLPDNIHWQAAVPTAIAAVSRILRQSREMIFIVQMEPNLARFEWNEMKKIV